MRIQTYVTDRLSETSTKLAAGVGIASTPILAEYAATAVEAGMEGDWVKCVKNAVPFLFGAGIAVYHIATPDKPQKPLTDALAELPADELRKLLAQSIIKADIPAGGKQE